MELVAHITGAKVENVSSHSDLAVTDLTSCPICSRMRANMAQFVPCQHYACPECTDDLTDNSTGEGLFECVQCLQRVVDVNYRTAATLTCPPALGALSE